MSTELILSAICLPADTAVDWTAVHNAIDRLDMARFRSDHNPNTIADRAGLADWDALLGGEAPETFLGRENAEDLDAFLDDLRYSLHGDLNDLQRLYDGDDFRDYQRLQVAGVDVLLAGGDSAGDSPGPTFDSFQRLHASGVLLAAGVLAPSK